MKKRLAIIGYGGMGNWHHKNIEERIDQIEVVGAYDVRLEAIEDIERNGLKKYESVEAILEDKTIDIVTIATPNDFHKDLAIRCLRGGKNVICEKPVTMNASELEEVMAVQKKEGKLFSIHQNRRWDKDYITIKEILRQKVLNKPYYIETRVQGSRRVLHGWRGHKVNGGGMILDWGVHLIDQVMDLMPEKVVDIYADTHSIYCDEVDDNFKATIKFESGLNVLIDVATNCFINSPRWHMCCEDGTVIIENWNCEGKIVTLEQNQELVWDNEIVYTEAGPTRTMAPRPAESVKELELPKVESNWTDYYENIVKVLDGKEELIVKPEQALRVMKVIDAMFKSAAEGRSISCSI